MKKVYVIIILILAVAFPITTLTILGSSVEDSLSLILENIRTQLSF